MQFAYVFNGQGAEVPGMGIDFYQNTLIFKEIIDRADAVLDFDLPEFLANGDFAAHPDDLQPALVAYSVAMHEVASAELPPETALAGLSLGEYSALIAGGGLSLEDGLKLVAARGKAMAAACQNQPGGMLAVMSGDQAVIQEACEQAPDVWPANYNGPKQTVLAGTHDALAVVEKWLKAQGVRAIPLHVAGGFHSPLMASAQPQLQAALKQANVFEPVIPVISTTALKPFTARNMRSVLAAQVAEPTKFATVIAQLKAEGVDTIVELGPKPVLSKMIKRIDRKMTTHLISDAASLNEVADLNNGVKAD
ncbi:ACP S-malonyltransferase [Lacticaseibacillus parahuelsenbergensis]|uniref:Malonyl CoA-acyl carrier protein transacylase n=1 Tax=Lacticaseibacillus parahuelsenbergensis TaxID=3068305 RepID=A0ABY9L1F5_9LACO|nr:MULTISPECIES: ACP S-malonyltransferase [Lacticaseibacillus]MDE3283067.1 ACP S-malonyltransferase [Lacticaseibacillus casei]WLV77205.1 ACP S-malonyltransferase [Lacticaseibacillus sp. NCIMB 15471]